MYLYTAEKSSAWFILGVEFQEIATFKKRDWKNGFVSPLMNDLGQIWTKARHGLSG